MEPDEASEESEVAVLLADGTSGDADKARRGLSIVYRLWARPVLALLRAVYTPSQLPAVDFEDVWQETVRQLAELVRGGRIRPEGSLFALVATIARRQAGRHVRRRAAARAVPLFDELVDTRDRRGWADLDAAERGEVLELTEQAIPSLPPKAATVMRVFIEHFPESGGMERLRELVRQATGRAETLAGVKRALQDAREGLRCRLRRRGYDFQTEGDQ